MADGDIDLVNRDTNGINAHLGVCRTFHDCNFSNFNYLNVERFF
jgi:hypothetical protein